MRWPRESFDPLIAGLLLAAVAACAIASAQSWRAAALGIAASSAVAATRVRFSCYGALALLGLVAVIALTGSS